MMKRSTLVVAMLLALALFVPAWAGQDATRRKSGEKAKQGKKQMKKHEGHGDGHGGMEGHGRKVMKARAEIAGDKISGHADLTEMESPDGQRMVHVELKLKGDPAVLKPGLHGVHLHQKGVCEAPYTSAGGHFDPGPASNNDPDANHPFHMGDLPNVKIEADGTGTLRAVTTRVTLSDGPLTLFDEDGTAIIIHANEDKMITGAPKSGVSGGPRAACGVIKKM